MMFAQQKHNSYRGFIALISAVIISTVLLGLALTAGASSAYSRFNALNGEYKRISLALAESCANVALLKIAQNYSYNPSNETVALGNDLQGRPQGCTIKSISYPNGKGSVQNTALITTQAQYPATNGAFSNITISSTVQNPAFAVPARASVVVQVHVNNDNGGTKQSGDFSASVSAGNPSPSIFPGAETGTIVYIDPGSFVVSGSNDVSYSKSTGSGCNGSLLAGETANCVITYDDIPTTASLTLTAIVINDNGGTWLPSDFPLYIDGVPSASGVPKTGLPTGFHTASADVAPAGYSASLWGTDCTVPGDGSIPLSAGQKKNCTIVYDDNPPPSPICVDTVMMLDRTGSMSGSDLTDERNAANGLLNLYDDLIPLPKTAIGVFGNVGSNEPYNAAIRQILTTTYSSLYSAVTTGLSSSNGNTNLASAISVSQSEFDAHGTPGKGHVLILLSDGGANRPSGGTVSGDTGFKSPTVAAQNASGDAWTNPTGAYGAGDASDSSGHRERYSNFGLSVPSGATVTNLEIKTDAFSSSVSATPVTVTLDAPSAIGNYDQWSAGGGLLGIILGKVYDVADDDGNSSYISETSNGQSQTFVVPDANIPAGSTINSVTLNAVAAQNGGSTNIILRVEKGSGNGNKNDDGGHAVTSTGYNTFSRVMATNPFTGSAWTLAEVNNWTTRFGVVKNTSGGTARVTQLYVTVSYTPPPVTCTVGIDASWNGGTTWTNEDTRILTSSSVSYTLSGSWGGHTWTPTDFSDANFRVRIHDTNPGATCHVDTLSARVSYQTVSDPFELALAAADTAKQAGTQIFTIHFGSKGAGNHDIDFLAHVANGNSSVTGHENGSANDLSGSPASGSTGYISPSTNIKDTGGDGNGFETGASNAYANGGGYASNIDGAGDRHRFGGYNFNIPAGATVAGIVVRPDWWTDSTSNTNSVSIELSWDGGAHWTTAKTQGSESTSDQNNKTVGASNDTWGHTWTSGDLSAGEFLVRATSNSSSSSRDFYLDWIPVEVFYIGAVPENGDDDNFYVSPTSADMQAIFQAIGEKVCPALTAPPPAPAPTHGTLLVLTHVTNDNGGTAMPADFKITVTGLNPSPDTFPINGEDSPGTFISLDPGFFTVSVDTNGLLYDATLSGCTNTMTPGITLTCTVSVDDLPPPAGSTGASLPPSNIIIGSWQEVP